MSEALESGIEVLTGTCIWGSYTAAYSATAKLRLSLTTVAPDWKSWRRCTARGDDP
jgi:hypothetical protein